MTRPPDPLAAVVRASDVRGRLLEQQQHMERCIAELAAAIDELDAAPYHGPEAHRETLRARVLERARAVVAANRNGQ